MDLTTADLDRMASEPEWHGFGYVGERVRTDAAQGLVAAADQDAIDAANQRGWTYEQLFEWANSKNGRWYGEIAFSGRRNAARYLPGQPQR